LPNLFWAVTGPFIATGESRPRIEPAGKGETSRVGLGFQYLEIIGGACHPGRLVGGRSVGVMVVERSGDQGVKTGALLAGKATSESYLPREIFDHTIDLLHDERETLRRCCFVSKLWVPRTQKHLFDYAQFRSSISVRGGGRSWTLRCRACGLLIDCPWRVMAAKWKRVVGSNPSLV